MTKKTDPSISISFPRGQKQYYLDRRDEVVEVFGERGINGFSAATRQFLDGRLQEIDGKPVWVVEFGP